MQAHNFHKPENVLKRAEEYISVGKKENALQLLHDMLQARRHKVWQKTHEKVMKRYLQLCVELKSNRMAKEGLHQYRNICQTQAPQSLEVVIDFMLNLADERVRVAATQCDKSSMNEVEDLETGASPEAILLAAVTTDKSKERSETEHLLPWLKFVWEAYRTVLEILRNNPTLEKVYHNTARKAFGFCVEYERKTEFRRLCDILRNHLVNQQKYARDNQGNIQPETMELHLATRFEQLRVSSVLRLWHEGFRTIEDIHLIMSLSPKAPTSQIMAIYYQKLTQLFLVANNFLFHAYALKAFYTLSKEKNTSLTKEQLMNMGSSVLLAAMAVPLPASKAGTTYIEESLQKEKNRRMAQLLGFDISPKRSSLISDLVLRDVFSNVIPDVARLYVLLEKEFSPLNLVAKVIPILNNLRTNKQLKRYIKPIENLLIIRTVSQLAGVYCSVKLEYFRNLFTGLDYNLLDIEKILVKAVKCRQITAYQVRIDHQSGCIRFMEHVMEDERTRRQLTDLAVGLESVCLQIEPVDRELEQKQREALAYEVLEDLKAQHKMVMERKMIIENRREEFEKLQAQRQREEKKRKEQEEIERKMIEERRLENQRRKRELEKQEMLRRQQELNDEKLKLIGAGVEIGGMDLAAMTKLERSKLIEDMKKKAMQSAMESEKKINAAAKRLDTMVRALREAELPLLKEQYVKQSKVDEEEYYTRAEAKKVASKQEHELAISEKKVLVRMTSDADRFRQKMEAVWEDDYEVEAEELVRKLKQDKIIRARQRLQQREEAERDQRELRDKERRRVEQEERLRQEEMDRKEEEQRRIERESQGIQAKGRSTLSDLGGLDGAAAPASTGKYQPPRRSANADGEARGGYGESRGGYGESRGGYGESRGGYGESRGGYGESRGGYGESRGGGERRPYGSSRFPGGSGGYRSESRGDPRGESSRFGSRGGFGGEERESSGPAPRLFKGGSDSASSWRNRQKQ